MFWDSHCHLDPEVYGSDEAVDAVVARAVSEGVTAMTTIGSGYGLRGARAAAAVSARHPDRVWFTVGVHPHDAKIWSQEARDLLVSLGGQPGCVALGEMGLDFHYDLSPRDQQRQVLREQVRLALSLDQPIVVHDRSAGREVLEILTDEGAFDGQVLWHCFTGDVGYMRDIVAMGGFISVPGIVTFKNAGEMRTVAAEIPDDRLLIETDSPYLTPTPHRGSQNEPAYVRHVAEVVADIRGVTPEALGALAASNTRRFYRVTS
jgi:TatD DNase family protein